MRKVAIVLLGVGVAAAVFAAEGGGPPQPWSKWKVHDMARPAPPVVTPGTFSSQETPGKAPSDAIVLFDGNNIDKWQGTAWKLENGYMEAVKGPIRTKDEFGDIQLHVEWLEPPAKGNSQDRGNSGIFLMGKFEIQVLDDFNNTTYPDGQCGAVYGQYPPEVNVCLPPGQWQTYDIIFNRPRFADGKMVEPGYVTVLQNGVLVQNHQRMEGPTAHMQVARYGNSFPVKGPLELQFHGNPIRYRNIWVRNLEALHQQQQTGDLPATTKEGK